MIDDNNTTPTSKLTQAAARSDLKEDDTVWLLALAVIDTKTLEGDE